MVEPEKPQMITYKVVQTWPGQTVTCLHTNSPGHIWTTLYYCLCPLHVGWLRLHTQNYIILIAFPQQQWLHECASILRYAWIACLVSTLKAQQPISWIIGFQSYHHLFMLPIFKFCLDKITNIHSIKNAWQAWTRRRGYYCKYNMKFSSVAHIFHVSTKTQNSLRK
jgi:hypothetical protein